MAGKKQKKVQIYNPDVYKGLGDKAVKNQNYEDAVEHYSKAIEIARKTPNKEYFILRAEAYLELEDYVRCIEDCDQAMQIDESVAKAYLIKAKAINSQISSLFNTEKLKEGLKTVAKGLELDPESTELASLLLGFTEKQMQPSRIDQLKSMSASSTANKS